MHIDTPCAWLRFYEEPSDVVCVRVQPISLRRSLVLSVRWAVLYWTGRLSVLWRMGAEKIRTYARPWR